MALAFRLAGLALPASVEAATDFAIPPAVFLLAAPVVFLAVVPVLFLAVVAAPLLAVLLPDAALLPPDLAAEADLADEPEPAVLLAEALFLAVLPAPLFAAEGLPAEADFELPEADLEAAVLLPALPAFAPAVLPAADLEAGEADLPDDADLPLLPPAGFVALALPLETDLLLPAADFELLLPADLLPEVLLPDEAGFELPEADFAVEGFAEAELVFLLPEADEPATLPTSFSAFFSTAITAFLVTLRAISPAASATASEIFVFGFPF